MNAWVYTFNVQYDPAGLIQLFGGRDAFNAKLDQLFVEQPNLQRGSAPADAPPSMTQETLP
jgi:putative alpha-1,2-mannosidase